MEPPEQFGARLRLLRQRAGLTQEALGHAAGVHPVEISRMEAGQRDPRLTTLLRLATVLEASLDDLAGREQT